jgi:hypothetical protein
MRWIVSVGALAGVWVCVFHAEAQQPGELSLYSIADEEVGADVVGLIMQAEQQWGDMSPWFTRQCYP